MFIFSKFSQEEKVIFLNDNLVLFGKTTWQLADIWGIILIPEPDPSLCHPI